MKRNCRTIVTTALLFFVCLMVVSSARAEQRDLPTAAGGALFSILGTIVALPVKIVTCTAMGAIGGIGYGATLGGSDFVQAEILSGIPFACQPVLKTTPPEIEPYLKGPQPQEMAW